MPDETSTPAKTAKEELKEQSPQVIVATAIAGVSQMLSNKDQGKTLAILAPVLSLIIVWSVRLLIKCGILLFNYATEKPAPSANDADEPLDVLLKKYIAENKKEARWLIPFSAERRQLNEARVQLRQRLHAYQMGNLVVDVNILPPVPPAPSLPPAE